MLCQKDTKLEMKYDIKLEEIQKLSAFRRKCNRDYGLAMLIGTLVLL